MGSTINRLAMYEQERRGGSLQAVELIGPQNQARIASSSASGVYLILVNLLQ